jgi:hypothetical protein
MPRRLTNFCCQGWPGNRILPISTSCVAWDERHVPLCPAIGWDGFFFFLQIFTPFQGWPWTVILQSWLPKFWGFQVWTTSTQAPILIYCYLLWKNQCCHTFCINKCIKCRLNNLFNNFLRKILKFTAFQTMKWERLGYLCKVTQLERVKSRDSNSNLSEQNIFDVKDIWFWVST